MLIPCILNYSVSCTDIALTQVLTQLGQGTDGNNGVVVSK